MTEIAQGELFRSADQAAAVETALKLMLAGRQRPSADELLALLDQKVGAKGRFDLLEVIEKLRVDGQLTVEQRLYLDDLVQSGELAKAMSGPRQRRSDIASSVDELLRQSEVYRSSQAFREMIEFMGRFRDYAPYNNMLVRLQNPSCSFYATYKDWRKRFRRELKEDAKPMVILAPMHPVLLVYALDDTEGRELPSEVRDFGRFVGPWEAKWLTNLVENSQRHRLRVDVKPLSSTHGGFAQALGAAGSWKGRIAIHESLDEPSRFGVLCHELAHVLLGHLGSDKDGWWPARAGIGRSVAEIEAESVAFIVTTRFGLTGSSPSYVAGHLRSAELPEAVSIDTIAKVASRIERMANGLLLAPKPRPAKPARTSTSQSGAVE